MKNLARGKARAQTWAARLQMCLLNGVPGSPQVAWSLPGSVPHST